MDSVIVTVVDEAQRFAVDMDLPTNLPLASLSTQISQLLAQEYPALDIGQPVFRVQSGKLLQDQETLGDAGVCGGAILIMAQRAETGR